MRDYRYTLCIIYMTALLCGCYGSPRHATDEKPEFLRQIRSEPVIPRHANTLFIAPVTAPEKHGDAAETLKELLIRELTSQGRLSIINDKKYGTDLQTVIRIYTWQLQVLSFTSTGTPERKRLLVKALCSLYEKNKKSPVFYHVPVQAFIEYSSSTAPVITDSEAENMVLQDLALRIASQIHSGWYTDRMTNIEKGKE